MSRQWRADGLERLRIPKKDGSIIVARSQCLAIWAERYCSNDTGLLTLKESDTLGGLYIPQADSLIISRCCKRFSIRAERYTFQYLRLLSEIPQHLGIAVDVVQ